MWVFLTGRLPHGKSTNFQELDTSTERNKKSTENPRNNQKVRSIIGGQTCDSHDIVCDFELEELEIGDWVVFYCLGAYSMSVATNFNGYEFRTRSIIQMPMKNNEVVNIPEEIEKKGIPALWGIPNTWKL